MNRIAYFLIAGQFALIATAQSKLPTVEEALQLSGETGRPVFAMAGRET